MKKEGISWHLVRIPCHWKKNPPGEHSTHWHLLKGQQIFPEWFKVRISAIEDSISVAVNEEVRITYSDSQYLKQGTFGIESFDNSKVNMDSVFVYGIMPDSIGYISGRLSDVHNNPIGDYMVNAGSNSDLLNCSGLSYSARTDSDGFYTLQLPFGEYVLMTNSDLDKRITPSVYKNIYGWNRISEAERINLISKDTVPNIDFELQNGHLVCGYLVDTLGNAISAGGNAMNNETFAEFGCSFGFGSEGMDGRFEVILPEGSYRLSFHDGTTSKTITEDLPVFKDTCLGEVAFLQVPWKPPSFNPKVMLPGYEIDTIIPGCPSSPVDVAYHDSEIMLSACWSGIFSVDTTGSYEKWSDHHTYGIESDFDGNLYTYSFPGGEIGTLSKKGEYHRVAKIPLTFCESHITVAPDGTIWIAYNGCGIEGASPHLFKVQADGSYEIFLEDFPWSNAIEADKDNNLFVGTGNEIYRIDIAGRALIHEITLPFGLGFHGLAADDKGNIYITCSDQNTDYVYKYTMEGDLIRHCELPQGDINGIDVLPNGDLVVVMRATGAVYYVYGSQLNKYKPLINGNGLSSPSNMIFGTKGELYIGNDESGRIARISPDAFYNYRGIITYNPPTGFFTVDANGDVYFSEAAPGIGNKLTRLISDSNSKTLVTRSIENPSGLAFDKNGNMIVSDYLSGNILSLSGTGQIETLYGGFVRPQALALDTKGNMFISAFNGVLQDPENPGEQPWPGVIWQVDSTGERQILATIDSRSLLILPQDTLFATVPDGRIVQVLPDGRIINFATGFFNPFGMAFNITGDLYITDAKDNSVVCISGFPKGLLLGDIVDAADQKKLSDVRVQIINDYPNIRGTQLLSDVEGEFSTSLAPDIYTAIISHENYQTRYYQFQMEQNDTINLDIGLELKPDTIPPQLVCRDTSLIMTEDCLMSIDESYILKSIHDENRIDSIYLNLSTFTCDHIGHEFTIAVLAIDEYGNTGQCNANVSITGVTGVFERNSVSEDPERFSVYPVPAEGSLHVEGGGSSPYKLTLYNIQGIPQLSMVKVGKKIVLEVGHLEEGLYLLQIQKGGKVVHRQRLIINGN